MKLVMQKKELWIRFDNKEQYAKQECEALEILKRYPGEFEVVIYLSDKNNMKKLDSIRSGKEAVPELNKLLGEENVKLREREIKYNDTVVNKPEPLERIADSLEKIIFALGQIDDSLGCINIHLRSIDDIASTVDDLGECISDSSRGKMFCVTGNITNYV